MLYEPEWIWLSSTPYSYFSKRYVIYSDVTWASWCLRSMTISYDQASNIENIKVLHCKMQNKNRCDEINSNSMTFCEIFLSILNDLINEKTTGKKLHIILFNFVLKCCKVQIHITGCFILTLQWYLHWQKRVVWNLVWKTNSTSSSQLHCFYTILLLIRELFETGYDILKLHADKDINMNLLLMYMTQSLIHIQVPLNTLRPWQNGCHFPDNISKCIFLNENV